MRHVFNPDRVLRVGYAPIAPSAKANPGKVDKPARPFFGYPTKIPQVEKGVDCH